MLERKTVSSHPHVSPIFLSNQKTMCQCPLCVERVSRVPVQHTDYEFIKHLKEGLIEHIGLTPDGRPIYVWTGP